MRDYGKVYSRFWASRDMRTLSDDGRYLALYLMTCKHCTLAGIFLLPDGYVCEDMQWTIERVRQGFMELFRNGFATRCEATKWVWITKHLEWNGLQNPNQAKAAVKILTEVPADCCWLAGFETVFEGLLQARGKRFGTVAKQLPNASATVAYPVSVSVSESVSESVTVSVTETVGFGAEAGPDPETENGCVSRGVGNSIPEGKANGSNGHGPAPPEPPGFTSIRAVYPERAGDPRWADALASYTASLDAGYSPQEMLDGVMRYARYCAAEGITGTKFVQAPHTFLGANHAFSQSWKPGEKPTRETTAQRWVREGEAKDAAL